MSHTQRQQGRKKRRRRRGVFSKLLLVAAVLFGIGVFSLFLFFFSLTRNLPSLEAIGNRKIIQSTKIYDRTGKVLLYEISSGKRRTVIPSDKIPKFLKDATVAIEDENFYSEPAFSWRGILRAAVVNFFHAGVVQGGSTITQQLAKNAFLSPERTFSRKIRELILAMRIEQRYSKDEILTLYLNEVSYGGDIYGVEEASLAYFGKSASDLTLAESALLAAIPKAPSYYSPWGTHVNELFKRQQFILKKMRELGMIDEQQLTAALGTKIQFAPRDASIKAPHFVLAVQDELVARYGEDLVRTGGLRVLTTLDYDLQKVAEKVVAEGAVRNEELYQGKNAALVAEDPRTGQILAMVGSRNYFETELEGNFNVATQGLRQPGSALKPFVYLEAFRKGYTPDTILFDVPTEFRPGQEDCPPLQEFFNDENKECYHPENFDGIFRGPMTMRDALAQSVNVPAVKTLYLVGIPNAINLLQSLGISTISQDQNLGLSLVLGGGGVHLVDLVHAYAALAADGTVHPQTMILEVRDAEGRVLESYRDHPKRVLDPQPVRLINNVLSDIRARSGLFHHSIGLTVFPDHEVALKTGTSDDYRDAWSLGYTPSIVVGVWAGNNDNTPMVRHGSSILAAVPIWSAFMKQYFSLRNPPPEPFPRPDPVIAAKPILQGNYAAGRQIHTILYYVRKDDPQGPPPEDPSQDPQFANWEAAVLAWARQSIPNFDEEYNQGASSTIPDALRGKFPPFVRIEVPAAGDFVRTTLSVRARIDSEQPLVQVNIYWNGTLVGTAERFEGEKSYELQWEFRPSPVQPQNLLEVEAVNAFGETGRASVIVYGNG